MDDPLFLVAFQIIPDLPTVNVKCNIINKVLSCQIMCLYFAQLCPSGFRRFFNISIYITYIVYISDRYDTIYYTCSIYRYIQDKDICSYYVYSTFTRGCGHFFSTRLLLCSQMGLYGRVWHPQKVLPYP